MSSYVWEFWVNIMEGEFCHGQVNSIQDIPRGPCNEASVCILVTYNNDAKPTCCCMNLMRPTED